MTSKRVICGSLMLFAAFLEGCSHPEIPECTNSQNTSCNTSTVKPVEPSTTTTVKPTDTTVKPTDTTTTTTTVKPDGCDKSDPKCEYDWKIKEGECDKSANHCIRLQMKPIVNHEMIMNILNVTLPQNETVAIGTSSTLHCVNIFNGQEVKRDCFVSKTYPQSYSANVKICYEAQVSKNGEELVTDSKCIEQAIDLFIDANESSVSKKCIVKVISYDVPERDSHCVNIQPVVKGEKVGSQHNIVAKVVKVEVPQKVTTGERHLHCFDLKMQGEKLEESNKCFWTAKTPLTKQVVKYCVNFSGFRVQPKTECYEYTIADPSSSHKHDDYNMVKSNCLDKLIPLEFCEACIKPATVDA